MKISIINCLKCGFLDIEIKTCNIADGFNSEILYTFKKVYNRFIAMNSVKN